MSNRSFRGVRVIHFSEFELDLRASELRRNGVRIRLQEQPYRILCALLERPGDLVSREEVRKRLWPNDTVVEVSHGINAAVQRLREAIGDSAENPRYIETVPRRGYRFAASVQYTLLGHGQEAAAIPPPEPETLEGNSVSHFRVREKLGGGGMGVVYRADDLTLGRQVALKFLPRELATDPGALSRFRREAQAASSLNHPNICTIYGVEEHEGKPVIVMELLEGETLEATLTRGPLSVERAVALAIRIADALDAAHSRGIVHRDIKPSNILLGKFGLKVLDFGLAKMERNMMLSLEGPPHVTQQGIILGTLHYMSPEQVQGKESGASGDIFSFGTVLYEMLAGRKAFEAPNTARVMAAILTQDPPRLERPVPPALDLVLKRCLAKEPETRWQTARDLKAALELVSATPEASAVAPRTTRIPRFGWLLAFGGFLVSAVAALLYNRHLWEQAPRRAPAPGRAPVVAFKSRPAEAIATAPPAFRELPKSEPDKTARIQPGSPVVIVPGMGAHPALSPDGRRVAFTSGSSLYVKMLNSDEVRLLGRVVGAPFWAPDSLSVAATSEGWLMRFYLNGHQPLQLCKVDSNLAGAWGPDGTILQGFLRDGLYRIPTTGGPAVRVTTLDSTHKETRHFAPSFLPGGQRFIYIRASSDAGQSRLYTGSLTSDEQKEIMPVESNVEWVVGSRNPQEGYLVSTAGGMLTATAFNSRTLAVGATFSLGEAVSSTRIKDGAPVNADFSVTSQLLAFSRQGNTGVTLIRNWKDRLGH